MTNRDYILAGNYQLLDELYAENAAQAKEINQLKRMVKNGKTLLRAINETEEGKKIINNLIKE